jgi:hypothetical protein
MSKKYKPVHYKCDHETKGVDTKVTVSDFHPLSKREIRNLLCHAKQTGNNRVRNSIQIRLSQGIKGYVCPCSISGGVLEKELAISQLYLNNMYVGPTNRLVNELFSIMNR